MIPNGRSDLHLNTTPRPVADKPLPIDDFQLTITLSPNLQQTQPKACFWKPDVSFIIPGMSDEPNTQDDKSRLISLPEAAELYGFSADYLGNLARNGRLTANKVGNSWVTTPEDVEEYIRSRKEMGRFRDDIQVDN